jgi:hypothetical protein
MCCRGSHELANPAYLSSYLRFGFLRVALYCVSGGVREVSNDPHANTEAYLLPHFSLTYAESKMVTDGTRTRALRSHNPISQLSLGVADSQYCP